MLSAQRAPPADVRAHSQEFRLSEELCRCVEPVLLLSLLHSAVARLFLFHIKMQTGTEARTDLASHQGRQYFTHRRFRPETISTLPRNLKSKLLVRNFGPVRLVTQGRNNL